MKEEERTNATLLHTHSAFLRQSSLEELEECREAARFPLNNNKINELIINWILTLPSSYLPRHCNVC